MAITRSMTAKLNQDASRRKRPETVDNEDSDSESWSALIHDILISVIMRLGVIDFVGFSGVCKSWRTLALSNRNMFMLSREPMQVRISTPEVAEGKECYFEDLEGRKFKTLIPCSRDSICLGLASGYLVLLGLETRDFKLVNPVTRYELDFPKFPLDFNPRPGTGTFRCTLVFSPTMSTWVFVFLVFLLMERVYFSFPGKQGNWTHLSAEFFINDLFFFRGKIYTVRNLMNENMSLYEFRINSTPTFTLLKMKNLTNMEIECPEFATWGEKLYFMGPVKLGHGPYLDLFREEDPYVHFETDFDQMRIVKPTQALKNPVYFTSEDIMSKVELWMEPFEQYERFGCFSGTAKNKRMYITEDMWYFPQRCLDVNILHE